MRIISQDGEYDIPYESSVLRIEANVIWAFPTQADEYIVAQYSTQEKAEKAMQMLHEAYTGAPLIMNNAVFPEGFDEQLKNMRSGFISVVDHGDKARIEPIIVFRFPSEDDI